MTLEVIINNIKFIIEFYENEPLSIRREDYPDSLFFNEVLGKNKYRILPPLKWELEKYQAEYLVAVEKINKLKIFL
jgi:hypothetical protein